MLDKDASRVVIIREVNMVARKVVVEDATSGQFQVSWHLLDPLISIPAPGEGWLVCRMGVDWFLERRIETGAETIPITDLTAGDKRLEANNLYLIGEASLLIQSGTAKLYIENGALKFKGSNGTITTIAPA